jgi:hypothetical protein
LNKFDFIGFAREVHQVAVEHGWWEGERDEAEIYALIHSEWSEALEEHRAGRPMVWQACNWDGERCEEGTCKHWNDGDCDEGEMDPKPEGIAVELIDGVLRCMDYLAAKGKLQSETFIDGLMAATLADTQDRAPSLPLLVVNLHAMTTLACMRKRNEIKLWGCVSAVWDWIEKQGVDPEAVIRAKHEYNKTRPYKHGKRY